MREVMVSDDSSDIVFVAALTDSTPEELEKSVRQASGTAFRPRRTGVAWRAPRPAR